MHVSEINIYPIKSLKGIALESAVVEERGLRDDRRWMLTDMEGKFLTQREFPQMALIEVAVADDVLVISRNGSGGMQVPLRPETGNARPVTIWQSVCDGVVYSDDVNAWLSDWVGTECQLVYMPDDSRRSVNPRFDRGNDVVSFADGYPLLVIGEASLNDLNRRIADSVQESHADRMSAFRTVPMNRFRPNLVVSGSDAFAEDEWSKIRIGDAVFRSTKPCERCVITTIDQAKGDLAGKEPLKTLASYRMAKDVMPHRYESLGVGANAVLFGQNLIAENYGATIKVGESVEILD